MPAESEVLAKNVTVLRHAILQDDEIVTAEVADVLLRRIADRHVERDEIDTSSERRCRPLAGDMSLGTDGDDGEEQR